MADFENTAGMPIDDEELDQVAGGVTYLEDFKNFIRPMEELIVPDLTPEQENEIDMMNNLLNNSSSLDLNPNLEFDSSLINMDYLNSLK